MFFRGAQFQRDAHGGCTRLSEPILRSNGAKLSALGVMTPTHTLIPTRWARAVTHHRQLQELLGCSDRDPVDATRSTFLGPRSERRICIRLQPASHRSPSFESSFGERLKQIHHPARQDRALRSQGANDLVPRRRIHKGLVRARASA